MSSARNGESSNESRLASQEATALNERLGDRRWFELLRAHNRIVRDCVREHGGYEVKAQGDGFMVAYPSVRRALECAIDMERNLAGATTR